MLVRANRKRSVTVCEVHFREDLGKHEACGGCPRWGSVWKLLDEESFSRKQDVMT